MKTKVVFIYFIFYKRTVTAEDGVRQLFARLNTFQLLTNIDYYLRTKTSENH